MLIFKMKLISAAFFFEFIYILFEAYVHIPMERRKSFNERTAV